MITIDTTNNDYPRFIEKSFDNPLWIECEVEISKNNIKKGKIIKMTSSGKYIVEIIK